MSVIRQVRETLEDLYRTPEKSELVRGRIVRFMATGHRPNRVAGRIFRGLDDYADRLRTGVACTGNIGFAIPELPSGRESFSPDVAYYDGLLPQNLMRFIEGPPTFAVEVRSESDYGNAAIAEMADKRADYFAAGTQVVWDVYTVTECIHGYKALDPNRPVTYRRGEMAEAEPAVPGWSVAVDWVFS